MTQGTHPKDGKLDWRNWEKEKGSCHGYHESSTDKPTFCTFICDMTWAYYTEKVGSFFFIIFQEFGVLSLVLCISLFLFFFFPGKGEILYCMEDLNGADLNCAIFILL